jgi:DUF4097 and DUF4098 domain-containing protein YvlB
MHALLARLLIVLFTIVSAAWLAHAGEQQNISVNTNEEAVGMNCESHFNVSMGNLPIFRAEEERTIPQASISKLRVYGLHNGGVLVRGWDKTDIFIKACKAAAANDEHEARSMLNDLKLEIQGGDVTVRGAEGRNRWVHLLVNVPKQIAAEFETHNGPLSLRNVSAGSVQARTVNGPVAVKDCTGKITVDVRNGPVSLVRSSGDIHLTAQNGPMEVELTDTSWKGQGLEASTRNGPLELKIPTSYNSGVEVRAEGHSPFSCGLDACKDAVKDWDENSRSVRFGKAGAPTVVRLSTVNGPVTIRRALASF